MCSGAPQAVNLSLSRLGRFLLWVFLHGVPFPHPCEAAQGQLPAGTVGGVERELEIKWMWGGNNILVGKARH